MVAKQDDEIELVYTIEGERDPRSRRVRGSDTAARVVETVAGELGRDDIEAMYAENADKPLANKTTMREATKNGFAVFHIGSKHRAKVEVTYNGRVEHEQFAPGVTISRILDWAFSGKGFGLEGESCDFQLKLGADLLPADLHIGQIANGREPVRLILVFKIKPQG